MQGHSHSLVYLPFITFVFCLHLLLHPLNTLCPWVGFPSLLSCYLFSVAEFCISLTLSLPLSLSLPFLQLGFPLWELISSCNKSVTLRLLYLGKEERRALTRKSYIYYKGKRYFPLLYFFWSKKPRSKRHKQVTLCSCFLLPFYVLKILFCSWFLTKQKARVMILDSWGLQALI